MKSSYELTRKMTSKIVKEYIKQKNGIPNGAQVKLNLSAIQKDPNYQRKSDKWKEWIEQHKEEIFTVEYDPKFEEQPKVVTLKEDTSNPKWLWFIGDLDVL